MKTGTMPHKPRKRFGQNFLHDAHVIAKIIGAINPQPTDTMVEIGPGMGAMTRPLLQAMGKLTVVELDRDLIPLLQMTCSDAGRLTIEQADALRYDFASLSHAPHSLRVVGNLPYNISTPLLFHLIEQAELIKDMHFMLQKEVVERITARPDTPQYGRLSIMLQYYCQTELLFTVKPGAFNPPPKVDSAIVRLTPHHRLPHPVPKIATLQTLVTQAFNQRRKTLRNSLKAVITEAELKQLNIDPQLRPENLSLADYTQISTFLTLEKNL